MLVVLLDGGGPLATGLTGEEIGVGVEWMHAVVVVLVRAARYMQSRDVTCALSMRSLLGGEGNLSGFPGRSTVHGDLR